MDKTVNVLTERSLVTGLSVIEHLDALWIVTEWLDHKTKPLRRPKRIIRMTGLQYQRADRKKHGADFLVNQTIPRGILFHEIPPERATGFVVVDMPEIFLARSNPR